MTALFVSIGVLLIMLGISVVVIGAIRYFFPAFEQWIPDGWQTYLSLCYGSYYLIVGFALIVVF